MKRLGYCFGAVLALASLSAGAATDYRLKLTALDMERVAAEDLAMADKLRPMRFAIGRDVDIVPGREGAWRDLADGTSEWKLVV